MPIFIDRVKRLHRIAMIGRADRIDSLTMLLLGFPLSILCMSTFSLALGIPVTAFCFWVPLALFVGYALLGHPPKIDWRHPLVVFVLVLALALLISWYLQDFTWDSREYHIPASIMIANGWNPIYHPIPPMEEFGIHFYPKGQAIITAATLRALGSFEAGKFTKYLYLAASLMVVFRVLRREYGFGKFGGAFVAIIATCNTIVIFQLSTNYIDGAIASLYFIEIFAMLGYLRSQRLIYIWMLMVSALLMISLKSTGLFYSVAIIGVVSLWHLFRHRFKNWTVPLLLATSVLVGIALSFNPYITNTLEKGNPLYPFGTPVAKQVIKRPYFKNMNRLERYFFAYTSAPSVIPGNEKDAMAVWRSPFRTRNWNGYWLPEDLARTIGAFGPFFTFIFIPSLALLLFLEFELLLATGVVVITLLMHKEGWHARYCPQTFLLPCFIFISMIRSNWQERGKLFAYSGLGVILISELVLYANGPSVLDQSRSYRALAKQYVSTFGAIDDSFLRQFLPAPVLGSAKQAAPFFLMTERERARDMGYEVLASKGNQAAYGSLEQFIESYQADTIVIAVRDEASHCLPKPVVTLIDSEGGHLSMLPYRGSYVAVIHHGHVIYDQSNQHKSVSFNASNVRDTKLPYRIQATSAGWYAGNKASIVVNGNNFSMNRRGLNVVALVGTVAISRNFDTFTCNPESSMPAMFAIPRR